MAGHHCDAHLVFSSKLAVGVLLVILMNFLCILTTATYQKGLVADCIREETSSWHPLWYKVRYDHLWNKLLSEEHEGTKCQIQCPVNCSCSLSNLTEVLINCTNENISVAHVSYPANVTLLSWAHNKLHGITKDSFSGLTHSLLILYLNNNRLQYLHPFVFDHLHVKLMGLDLRDNMLQEISPEVFSGLSNLLNLDTKKNMIEEIQPCAFCKLEKLLTLQLGSNVLEVIEPGVFDRLGNLRRLYLDSNMLEDIQTGVFDGLGNLTSLYLDSNMLEDIQPGVFDGLGNLTSLYLRNNMLEDIQPGVFDGLGKLEGLYLDSNILEEIQPGVFDGLGNLASLDLLSNMLEEIQPGVFDGLGNLARLDLLSNMLEEIQPGVFDGLGNLEWLYLDGNMFREIQPGLFDGLGNLTRLYLQNNMLEDIQPGVFDGLGNMTRLYLQNNMLEDIQPGVFDGLDILTKLFLDNNMIKGIQPGLFGRLGNLRNLHMHNNRLEEIQPGLFDGLGNLIWLWLNGNILREIQPGAFDGLRKLTWLDLQNNMLGEIKAGVFDGLVKLEWLFLDSNKLQEIQPSGLRGLNSLGALYMSDNSLAYLYPDTFQNLTQLDYLKLDNNNLKLLPQGIFRSLEKMSHLNLSHNYLQELGHLPFQTCKFLLTLNLTGNPLQWLKKEDFTGLDVTAQVFVDKAASCCFVTKLSCKPNIPKTAFLTCGRLLGYDILRVGIWVVSMLAISTNVASFLARCKQRLKTNKVQFLLITNLSISDFIMGLYLIILRVLSVDLYYQEYFPSHSEAWRSSYLCKIAGSLSVLSSEASVFFITTISIDRAIAIKFPFRAHRLRTKSTCILISLLWLIVLAISITSFALSGMDSDIYAVSEICVGLPISRQPSFTKSETAVRVSNPRNTGAWSFIPKYKASGSQVAMYFSIAIFTCLNLLLFSIVGFCYLFIFYLARKSTKKSGRSMNLKEDIHMAKKMSLLVLTDFCCWVPIGVLSILVQAGAVEVNPTAYAWIATFILPINSSINPFLYTLGDVIADKVSCSCNRCKHQSGDENVEMRAQTRDALSLSLSSKVAQDE